MIAMPARTPSLFCRAWNGHLSIVLVAVATWGCSWASKTREAPSPSAALQSPGLELQVQAARADAARRTGIDAASLELAAAEQVTWLDGSLGCPEPEVMYTQALVPGYRVRLVAGGKVLDYHADALGKMVLCPPERAVAPAAPRGQPAVR
jgi:hypothetical protein